MEINLPISCLCLLPLINIDMRLYEFSNPLKIYVARVRLANGQMVVATEQTTSLAYARAIFSQIYGDKNVLLIQEHAPGITEIEETVKVVSPQDQQVKAMAQQAKQMNQQAKMMKAKQSVSKAKMNLQNASQPLKV